MKATLLAQGRQPRRAGGFVQYVVWHVPQPLPPSTHGYKYSLVYIVDGKRVVGFDNERGKGDHYHLGEQEHPYVFTGLDALFADFADVMQRYDHEHNTGHGNF